MWPAAQETFAYGAIGIKTVDGGGNVASLVGQSRHGKHCYTQGGNQDDEVNISEYKAAVCDAFFIPPNAGAGETLGLYLGPFKKSGEEA